MKNANRRDTSQDEIIDALKGLRPAASKMNPSTIFYQAGFQAGQKTAADSRTLLSGSHLVAIIAVAVVTAVVTGPASYRIGQSSVRTETIPNPVDRVDIVAADPTAKKPSAARLDTPPKNETTTPIIVDDPTSLFAQWLGRLQPSRETPDPSMPETLSVFHATRLGHDQTMQPWLEVGTTETVLKQNEQVLQDMAAENSGPVNRPLTVRDTDLWAQALEVSR